jgi:hypothetical protein
MIFVDIGIIARVFIALRETDRAMTVTAGLVDGLFAPLHLRRYHAPIDTYRFRKDASSSRRMIACSCALTLCVVHSAWLEPRVGRFIENGESRIMKSWVNAVVAVVVMSAPLASFAQFSAAVGRAELSGELVQLQKAGYLPVAEDASYPAKLQAAEMRVGDMRAAQARAEGYGSSTGAAAQSGRASMRVDTQGAFFGQ